MAAIAMKTRPKPLVHGDQHAHNALEMALASAAGKCDLSTFHSTCYKHQTYRTFLHNNSCINLFWAALFGFLSPSFSSLPYLLLASILIPLAPD